MKRKEEKRRMELPESVLVNIVTRLPLKSIARLRVVSREWKSLLDSDFFRDHYISVNSSSSVSWSIIQTKPHKLSLEIVGHHGCQRWGLSRSPGSLVSFFAETAIKKLMVLSCTDGLVLISAEYVYGSPTYYVGNPLLQDWFPLRLPPFLSSYELGVLRDNNKRFTDTGLVTKMENGVVVSYKVVWMLRPDLPSDQLEFMIYSSHTGTWSTDNVSCTSLRPNVWSAQDKSIALNGILHWLGQDTPPQDATCIVAYDFYGNHDDGCLIVPFPGGPTDSRRFKRTFTTSQGSIVYFNEFQQNGNRALRVWKLLSYTNAPQAWQLSWEINLASVIDLGPMDYFPVVMHPLNSDIIYLWSKNDKGRLILFNLRTLVFSLHQETADQNRCMDGCILSFNWCREYMDEMYSYYLLGPRTFPSHLFFSQYVLPRWLHRLPRPLPHT